MVWGAWMTDMPSILCGRKRERGQMFLWRFILSIRFLLLKKICCCFCVFSWHCDVHGNRPWCTSSVYGGYSCAAYSVRCFCYATVGGCSCCPPYSTNCYYVYWHRENNVWKVCKTIMLTVLINPSVCNFIFLLPQLLVLPGCTADHQNYVFLLLLLCDFGS